MRKGMPYTGLKPAQPLPPVLASAEKALQTGDMGPLSGLLADEMHQELERLFVKAREAKKHKDENLAAGREWADAYVKYVIYVHGLYKTIKAGPAHGAGE